VRAANLQHWSERLRAGLAHPRLPDAVSLALVVLLGWNLAGLTWAALPTPASARLPAASTIETPGGDAPDSREAPTARLARLHLFGEADAAGASGDGPERATDAPETQLDLTLKGVYAPGKEGGIAIIAAGGGPENVYSVGDTIAGSARITGIFADRVVLRRGGQAETLRMEFAQESPGPGDRQAQRSDASTDGAGIVERARALRERIRQNPMELARMVRFQPYVEDGELVGFRIQPRSDEAAVLQEAGIRPEDVVTRVNGIPLNDRAQANRALEELRDASMINVTILRDGRSERLSIPIGDAG
jgi:general secretion pathway protein C